MDSSMTFLRGDAPPLVIAHRGSALDHPENTMVAFGAAWDAGAIWVETDVQPASDGVPVLIHDDALDRTTSGIGSVRALPSDVITALDAGAWFGPAFAGTAVPTLTQLLASVTADRRVLLEIKGEHTEAQLRRVLQEIGDAGCSDRVFLQSFEVGALQSLRLMLPDEPLGLLVEEIGADPVTDCQRLGAITYNPDALALLERPEIVGELHAAGIALQPWTANDPDQWAQLTELGVDGIITDDPAGLLGWLQRDPGRK